jgi:hypothetical protein
MQWTLKNIFIPREGNDHRPHVLRPRAIGLVVAVLVVVQFIFFFATSYVLPRSRLFGIIEVSALTDGTNQARATDDISALQMSPLLQAAAQEKANDMAMNNYFAHTSPAGLTPWYWFNEVGYDFSRAGENLAVNFSDSGDVTAAWLNSPEHRANILDPHFTQIGIAVAQGTYNGHAATYVVELFGTPVAGAVASNPVVQIAKAPVASAVKPPSTVATTAKQSTNTGEASVAVKGAEIQAGNVALATETIQAPVPIAPTAGTTQSPQANFVQRAFANPTGSLDSVYYLVLLFFVVALGLNVFVRIRTQHPDVILGGLVAILLAGLFILVNQQAILQVVIK